MPDAGATAPEIWRTDERFGDGDGIVRPLVDRESMAGDDIAAAVESEEPAFPDTR